MADQEMKQSLVYLCNPKLRVLLKDNLKKPDFTSTENIKVNVDFSSNNLKCNFIPTVSHKRKTPGSEKTANELDEEKEIRMERQNIIDAVIVRIMKVDFFINSLGEEARNSQWVNAECDETSHHLHASTKYD